MNFTYVILCYVRMMHFILDFKNSQRLCELEVLFVLTSKRKSWSSNTLILLVLIYDLSFKVICDFQELQVLFMLHCTFLAWINNLLFVTPKASIFSRFMKLKVEIIVKYPPINVLLDIARFFFHTFLLAPPLILLLRNTW